MLGAPTPGKPLVLYVAAQEESLGALLAQENEEHKEKALYYLSRRLTPTELKYSPIEKTCLALVFCYSKAKTLLPSAYNSSGRKSRPHQVCNV